MTVSMLSQRRAEARDELSAPRPGPNLDRRLSSPGSPRNGCRALGPRRMSHCASSHARPFIDFLCWPSSSAPVLVDPPSHTWQITATEGIDGHV